MAKCTHGARAKTARVVPSKGGLDEVVKTEARDIRAWGVMRFVYKSDQEPAILDLRNKVIKELGSEYNIVPETSPVGEHESNGTIERAVQATIGMIRALKVATERAFKIALEPKSPVLQWLVQFAGFALTRYETGADGKTPYERAKGKQFKMSLPIFGEKVYYMKLPTELGRRKNALKSKWEEGCFLGCREETTEFYIGTPNGVGRSANIRRLPPSQRYDSEALLAVAGTPFQPTPGTSSDTVPAVPGEVIVHIPPATMLPADLPVEAPEPFKRRRVYIKASDLREHGWTRGCPRCEDDMIGVRSTAPHTEACRARMEKALESTEQGRKRLRDGNLRR